MAEKKRKRNYRCTSSSSDDNDDEVENEGDDSGDDYDDQDEECGLSASRSDDEMMVSDDDDDDLVGVDDNDDSICNKVTRLLQERSNMQVLNLKECKVYLRKHGLRVTGTKDVCMERIKEHWRIKNGNGEVLYPRSSFVINCKGDVCKGDVVLFEQKVYAKFDKAKRTGNILGSRTVAGRVVKESYGAAKQQHTFTVEVLWSKGTRKLPPLFPLLVKGRNLYKLKTRRQRWKSEAERLVVLDEKHERGKAARLVRAKTKAKKNCSSTGGAEHQKHFNHTKPSGLRQTTKSKEGRRVDERGKAPTTVGHAKLDYHCQSSPPIKEVSTRWRAPESLPWHQDLVYPPKLGASNNQLHTSRPQNLYQPPREFHHAYTTHCFSSHEIGSTSNMMRSPPFWPQADSFVKPSSQHQVFNDSNHRAFSNPSYESEIRNLNSFPVHPFSLGTETNRRRKKGYHAG